MLIIIKQLMIWKQIIVMLFSLLWDEVWFYLYGRDLVEDVQLFIAWFTTLLNIRCYYGVSDSLSDICC